MFSYQCIITVELDVVNSNVFSNNYLTEFKCKSSLVSGIISLIISHFYSIPLRVIIKPVMATTKPICPKFAFEDSAPPFDPDPEPLLRAEG